MSKEWDKKMREMPRSIEMAKSGDVDLGPFKWLPEGTWKNASEHGFNLIALPFHDGDTGEKSRGYRVLVNKYKEELEFTLADKGAPNRGVIPVEEHDCNEDNEKFEPCNERDKNKNGKFETQDQFAVTLDYIQIIKQVKAVSFPDTTPPETGEIKKKIHHEPGLFLRMSNPVETTIQRKPTVRNVPLNLARLATIPHGDSVLALGSCETLEYSEEAVAKMTGEKADAEVRAYLTIPKDDFRMGMPQGTTQDLGTPDDPGSSYLEQYRKTHLDGFDPVLPQKKLFEDLKSALGVETFKGLEKFPIKKTTRIFFDTELETGGILNIPFVTKQANAAAMRSTFWIHELDTPKKGKEPKLVLQYLQTVLLDFHVIRSDDMPGRIRWPHISINTLKKVPNKKCTKEEPDKGKSHKGKSHKR